MPLTEQDLPDIVAGVQALRQLVVDLPADLLRPVRPDGGMDHERYMQHAAPLMESSENLARTIAQGDLRKHYPLDDSPLRRPLRQLLQELFNSVRGSFYVEAIQEPVLCLARLDEVLEDIELPMPTPKQPRRRNGPKKKATVNERMILKANKEPDTRYWAARTWADFLVCSVSTVHDTATWKEWQSFKEAEKLHRKMKARI